MSYCVDNLGIVYWTDLSNCVEPREPLCCVAWYDDSYISVDLKWTNVKLPQFVRPWLADLP